MLVQPPASTQACLSVAPKVVVSSEFHPLEGARLCIVCQDAYTLHSPHTHTLHRLYRGMGLREMTSK